MQDNFYSAKDKIIDVVGFNSSIGYVVYAAVRKEDQLFAKQCTGK